MSKKKQKALKAKLLALVRKRKFKKEFRDEDAGVGLPPLTKGEIAEMKLEEKKERKRDKIAKEKKLKQPSRLLNPYKQGGGLPNSLIKGGFNNYRNRIK